MAEHDALGGSGCTGGVYKRADLTSTIGADRLCGYSMIRFGNGDFADSRDFMD